MSFFFVSVLSLFLFFFPFLRHSYLFLVFYLFLCVSQDVLVLLNHIVIGLSSKATIIF